MGEGDDFPDYHLICLMLYITSATSDVSFANFSDIPWRTYPLFPPHFRLSHPLRGPTAIRRGPLNFPGLTQATYSALYGGNANHYIIIYSRKNHHSPRYPIHRTTWPRNGELGKRVMASLLSIDTLLQMKTGGTGRRGEEEGRRWK